MGQDGCHIHDGYLDLIDGMIDEHGWAVQAVMSPVGEPGVGWCYTVGLEDQNRPELLMIGMPESIAHGLINNVVEPAMRGTHAWPEIGDTILGLAEGGYGLRVVGVDPDLAIAGEWCNVAIARRGHAEAFRVLQLVWQAADYSWPDRTSEVQPVLGPVWWKQAIAR